MTLLHVYPLQLERYKELKELARKQGAILSQQAEKLQWEVRADYEKMAFDQRRKKEVEVLSGAQFCFHYTSFTLMMSMTLKVYDSHFCICD